MTLHHYKLLITFIVVVFVIEKANAQNVQQFSFTLPDYKVQNSLYNQIDLLDQRDDTTSLGTIQKGLANKKFQLVSKIPLHLQLQKILSTLINDTAKSNQLLLQLRQLNFSEVTSTTSERGFFHINAALYVKLDSNYKQLGIIDTVVTLSAIDVTNGLLRKGSEVLGDYIAAYLTVSPSSSIKYSYAGVINNIESMDRKRMKAYHTDLYIDGVYLDYFSFCKQIPNGVIFVDGDSIAKSNIQANLDGRKFKKIKPDDVYAIVHNGKPYIATKFGYFPLKKTDGVFSFVGKIPSASTGDMLLAYAGFGVFAGNLVASNINSVFEIKIDKLNGSFIRVQEISQPDPLISN